MAMTQYQYTKETYDLSRFKKEIGESTDIITGLYTISAVGTVVVFVFKAALTEAEETALTALVTAHDGTPLPEDVPVPMTQRLDQGGDQFVPFGHKFTAAHGTTTYSYKQMPETLKLQGGCLVTEGRAMGDSVSCDIVVKGETLPEDVVVSLYVNEWQIYRDGDKNELKDNFSKSEPIPDSLHLRFKYTSVGDIDVQVGVNMFAYR
jgi:hypothetical protein